MAPTIDDKHMLIQHAGEELAHFELVSALYEQLSGQSLYEAVASQAETMPMPASWPEVVVAAYLVDHAAAVQLAAYQELGEPRLDRLIRKILDHEHEHKTAAETALLDLCQNAGEQRELARQHIDTWYPRACAVMDQAAEPRAKFARSVAAVLTRCGLQR